MDCRICDRFTDPVERKPRQSGVRNEAFRMPCRPVVLLALLPAARRGCPRTRNGGRGRLRFLGPARKEICTTPASIYGARWLAQAAWRRVDRSSNVAGSAARDGFSRPAGGAWRGSPGVRMRPRGKRPVRIAARSDSVDVALDTFPYQWRGTRTLDILWMSTPLVALRGDRGISRSSFSIVCLPGHSRTPRERPGRIRRHQRPPGDRRGLAHAPPCIASAPPVRVAFDGRTSLSPPTLKSGYGQMWNEYCSSPRSLTRPRLWPCRISCMRGSIQKERHAEKRTS